MRRTKATLIDPVKSSACSPSPSATRLACTWICLALAITFAGILAVPAGASSHSATGALRILIEPQAGMSAIDELLSSAKRTVDLEMYELADSTVESILARNARRGVDVRVILDKSYIEYENAAAFSYLAAHHVQVRWAPSRFDLTHEKAAVIDGTRALVMTMNFTARYYSTTRDFVVIDAQRADVSAITETFNGDWAGGEASPPKGADLLWSPGSEQALINLIDSARHAIYLENEEMHDPYITSALEAAARRGVKVTVVMTDDSEWSSAFNELESAGVRVRTYPYSYSALYIHAKVVDVDPKYSDERVFVGSQNFSIASLIYNRELGIITSNATVVSALANIVISDAAGAQVWP